MSYSGGVGRTFSKGSSQKRDRKKKQEFHKHKLKFTEEEHFDFELLKSRASVALDKLGHQVFSLEPGGYTFHDWMTSFNFLLDDFEEKSRLHLTKEYYDSRQKLTSDLMKPVDTSDIDPEIAKIESEIEATNLETNKLTREMNAKLDSHRNIVSQINHLKGERATKVTELGEASEALMKLKRKKSLFGFLKSDSASPVYDAKKNVESIQNDINSFDEKIKELEDQGAAATEVSDENISEMREKLGGLQLNLADWNEKKNQRLQLAEKRVAATAELSGIIGTLKLVETEEKNPDSE